MAKTKQSRQFKLDATRPLYAVVGAGDLAVEFARTAATDVQTRLSKVELEPKALRDQAVTVVVTRVDETVTEATETYGDLAARGKDLVGRIRRQQATKDAKAAGNTAVAKVKTARTQTTKSAKSSTDAVKNSASDTANTTKAAAKKTGNTAKSNVKATGTSAKKTASATARATSDAASKVGN